MRRQTAGEIGLCPHGGFALIAVLIILVLITGSSLSFIWFMNQQQARAGGLLRRAAAMRVAEAGIHRALLVLETVAPDGSSPGRTWRTAAYSEVLPVGPLEGRFTLSLSDEAGGAILITSVGEVADVTRRLRARVHLASPALLAGLRGASIVRLEDRPGAIFIIHYGAGIGDRPWIHIAAGKGLWFATADVSINAPSTTFEAGPGPVDGPKGADAATAPSAPGPVRLLLARGSDLMLGPGLPTRILDVQQLRVLGVYVEGVVLRSDALPELPEFDRIHYESQAAANTANTSLNEAAGRYFGDRDLASKGDSLYSSRDFERVQTYLRTERQVPRLRGVIYVKGAVSLQYNDRILISEGALITEGTMQLSDGASLEITHSAATRTLPGLIVLDDGALVVTREARLRVHGLVYANRAIDVSQGARVDIVGSLLGNDQVISFRNLAASVVIRYDPAVLGTPGLRVPDGMPVVAWVASWEELP